MSAIHENKAVWRDLNSKVQMRCATIFLLLFYNQIFRRGRNREISTAKEKLNQLRFTQKA